MFDVRSALATLALLAAATSLARAEACNHGICASSVSNGGFVSVTYHVQNGPVSHVNIRSQNFPIVNCEGVCSDPHQREGAPSGAFDVPRSKSGPTDFAIQACVRGGFLQRSSCGAWANFHHGT
jgi:hypothetical protein